MTNQPQFERLAAFAQAEALRDRMVEEYCALIEGARPAPRRGAFAAKLASIARRASAWLAGRKSARVFTLQMSGNSAAS